MTYPPGFCRVCKCTEVTPCAISTEVDGVIELSTCGWLDEDHTLCSNERCIALVPLRVLVEMPIIYRYPAEVLG